MIYHISGIPLILFLVCQRFTTGIPPVYHIPYTSKRCVVNFKSKVLLFNDIGLKPRAQVSGTTAIIHLYIKMFSIDTTENKDAIKQNDNEVEYSFNTMVYR